MTDSVTGNPISGATVGCTGTPTCTSTTTGTDGSYTLSTITLDQARSLIAHREIISAVGHQSTADILTTLLGREIPVNRIDFRQEREQAAIVFKLRGRPPEGAILSAEEVEAIGYDLKILDRY